MNSRSFDKGIVEAEFCFNKCRYHNHEQNWCNKYSCSIDDIDDCEFVNYDISQRDVILNF